MPPAWAARRSEPARGREKAVKIPVVAAQFLDEFARELGKIGERAFRRRYPVPVLIVSGRTPPARRRKREALLDTARERPDGVRALMSRVFPLVKQTGGIGPGV